MSNMRTVKDTIIVVLAWLMAAALVYIVIIKFRLLFK